VQRHTSIQDTECHTSYVTEVDSIQETDGHMSHVTEVDSIQDTECHTSQKLIDKCSAT
jgi:hypothetical protein